MNPNIYQAGLAPRQINTLNYVGTPLSTVPVVNVPRAPTVTDGQFPLFTLWRNSNTAATFPDAEGDLWYFAKVNASVYPAQYVWNKIATGTTPGGTMIGLTDTASTAVLPDGAGFIQLEAGAGITITSDAANNKLVIALTGGGPAVDTFTTDSGMVTPDGAGNVNLLGQNVAGSGIQVTGSGSTASYRMLSPYALGNFLFSRAVVGTNQFVQIDNLDNTNALSGSLLNIQSGGASGGNAWTAWGIIGVSAFAAGIDNADDAWKLTNSNTFVTAGATLLRVTNAGAMSVLVGDFDVTRAANSSTVFSYTGNLGTTLADAQSVTYVGASSTGDASWKTAIAAVISYCGGIDNSDSDSFKINTNGSGDVTPSTGTNLLRMSASGQQNLPLQSAFSAQSTSTQANATGDGTVVTLICGNEFYDQNAEYDNTTGIFTAKQAGKYQINATIALSNLGAAHTGCQIYAQVGTAPTLFCLWQGNPGAIRDTGNVLVISGSCELSLAATDTARIQVIVSGDTKTVGLVGNPANTLIYGAFSMLMEV